MNVHTHTSLGLRFEFLRVERNGVLWCEFQRTVGAEGVVFSLGIRYFLGSLSVTRHVTSTSDPVIINSLMDVARILHDSLDSLSFADERNQISQLILKFISKIDFGNDLEQHLNVYNDCRRSFTNLDSVTAELVSRVSRLAMTVSDRSFSLELNYSSRGYAHRTFARKAEFEGCAGPREATRG